MRCLPATALLLLFLLCPDIALADAPRGGDDPAGMCETAVHTAETAARLPPRLLGAISLTESGRLDPGSGRLRAWPWTINAEGEGRFFATSQQAVAALFALRVRGVQSIDVGCLQVNLMYHPRAFASPREAFDPQANARYAAGFLNRLFADGHDWRRAIAAYHSETPALGEAYRMLVVAHWQQLGRRSDDRGDVYRDFAPGSRSPYGAFLPLGRVYGAFEAPRYSAETNGGKR